MSIGSYLYKNLRKNPEFLFLAMKKDSQWNWFSKQQLTNAIFQSREQLTHMNVTKGDRVAFKGKNSLEWIAWNMATNSLGAIWVPMYQDQNMGYCNHIVNDCNPKVFISDDTTIEATIPVLSHELDIGNNFTLEPSLDFIHHPISTLIYTSGTTGSPKGVMLSNENILSNIQAIHQRFHDLPQCTSLNILPWAHIYSQTCELYYSILYDHKLAISSSRESFLKECREINPSTLYLVPRVLDMVKEKIEVIDKPLLRHFIPFVLTYLFGNNLRIIFTGGAKLNDNTKEFYHEHGYILCEGYGTTETSPMISVNHFQEPRDVETIGKVLDDILVEIVNDEIQVSGSNVMLGYWNNEPATNKVLVNRDDKIWYKTGDRGYLDDGYLYYNGRISENYKLSNGKFVNVQWVENIIKTHIGGNNVIFGENKEHNELITTVSLTPYQLKQINDNLDSYLKIKKVHYITSEELTPFLTPKMSIKRNHLIQTIEKRH